MFLEASSNPVHHFDYSLLDTLADVTLESISFESTNRNKGEFEDSSAKSNMAYSDFEHMHLSTLPLSMPIPVSPVAFSMFENYDSNIQTSFANLRVDSQSSYQMPKQHAKPHPSSQLRMILPKSPMSTSEQNLLIASSFTFPSGSIYRSASNPTITPFVFQTPDSNTDIPLKVKRKALTMSKAKLSTTQSQKTNKNTSASVHNQTKSPFNQLTSSHSRSILDPNQTVSVVGTNPTVVQSKLVHTGLKKGRLDIVSYSSNGLFDPGNVENRPLMLLSRSKSINSKWIVKRRSLTLKYLFEKLRQSLSLPGTQKYKKWDLLSKAIEKIENLKEKKKKIVRSITSFSKSLFKSSSSSKNSKSNQKSKD